MAKDLQKKITELKASLTQSHAELTYKDEVIQQLTQNALAPNVEHTALVEQLTMQHNAQVAEMTVDVLVSEAKIAQLTQDATEHTALVEMLTKKAENYETQVGKISDNTEQLIQEVVCKTNVISQLIMEHEKDKNKAITEFENMKAQMQMYKNKVTEYTNIDLSAEKERVRKTKAKSSWKWPWSG